MHWDRALLLVLGAATCLTKGVVALSQPQIRVCQNKHCLKANPSLLQTISQLTSPKQVETSGCLSHCDDGPNIEIIESDGTSQVLNGLVDATTASVLLEQALEDSSFPKVLIAASKVIERVATLQGEYWPCHIIIFFENPTVYRQSRLHFLESPFRIYIYPFLLWCYL